MSLLGSTFSFPQIPLNLLGAVWEFAAGISFRVCLGNKNASLYAKTSPSVFRENVQRLLQNRVGPD